MRFVLGTTAFVSCLLFLGSSIHAQEDLPPKKGETLSASVEIRDGKLVLMPGERDPGVDLMGEVLAVHTEGEVVYAAMGEQGAAVLEFKDGELMLVKTIPVSHGRVTGFMSGSGNVWLTVDSKTAVLVEGGVPQGDFGAPMTVLDHSIPQKPKTQDDETKSRQPPNRTSSVPNKKIAILASYPGSVKLNVGIEDGLESGDKLCAYRVVPGDGDDGEDSFEGREMVAVLIVRSVNETESIASLWRGDRVTDGDEIVIAPEDQQVSKAYPRNLENVGEVAASFRPLLNVGNDRGFGMLSDAKISYWGKGWFAGLRLQPMGFGATDDGNVVTMSTTAEGGYDGRAFAIGLGVGFTATNGDLDSMLGASYDYADSPGGDPENPEWSQRTKTGFTLAQVIRLGARDGFNFTACNWLVFRKSKDWFDSNEESGFIWGGAWGKMSIPLAMRVDLFLEGGGGVMGFWYSALGVQTWVRGNGEPGSVGVSASVGGAGIWGERVRKSGSDTENVSINGPMIGLGLNYRFGK